MDASTLTSLVKELTEANTSGKTEVGERDNPFSLDRVQGRY